MRVLITGGTGFLGSFVARQLVADGHDVVLYDLVPDESMIADFSADVSVVQGDIREAETLARTFEAHDVDCLIHTAALLRTTCEAKPTLAIDVNGVGTTRLLDLANVFGVERVVMASSIATYGYQRPADDLHVTEESPRLPSNLYGSCKVLNEDVGRHYADQYGTSVLALRFGTVYGPGQSRGSNAFKMALFERSLAGEPVTLEGVSMKPNWLYVRDAVDAVVRATAHDGEGFEAVNVHSGVATIEEAGRIVEEEIPGADVTYREEPPASRPGTWPIMDLSKAEKLLGYTPTYDLRAGTRDYVETLEYGGS